MKNSDLTILPVDSQCAEALELLRQAAIEARTLYPELHAEDASWPTNSPTPTGGIYLLAYWEDVPVASGALRPIDGQTVEVRRMYVLPSARHGGVGRAMLTRLEQEAAALGYRVMLLETGHKQQPAMRLYESYGFVRIPPFGEYTNDPTSVCYEKQVDYWVEQRA